MSSPSHQATASMPAKADSKPWLEKREWATPVIGSQAKLGMWSLLIFAAFWNLVSLPAGVFSVADFLKGNDKAIVGLVFPLAGLGLAAWAIALVRGYRRFGPAPLTMDPHPGSIGGQVGGHVDVSLPFDAATPFKSVLTCAYSYMSGAGKGRSRKERVVWQSQGYGHTRNWGGKTRVEVLFDVEPALPASDLKKSSSYHLWRLSIHADLPGADFQRSYEIPVFPTAAEAEQLVQLSTQHVAATEERMRAIEEVVELEQIPGGVQMFYPAFRHPAGKLMGMIFGLFFVSAGIFAGMNGAPVVFPILFPLLGGLVVLACFWSLCCSLRVQLDANGLKTEKRLLGLRVGGSDIPRSEIRALQLKRSYSTSKGNVATIYFKLQALTLARGKVDVGYNLAGRETAVEAMESISMLTGIPCETGEKSRAKPA